MATTKVVDVLDRASIILQDNSKVRYQNSELLKFFNDAQKEVVLHRPDANMNNTAVDCVAGSKQSLPTDGLRLIDVVQNTGGRAVTQISRQVLDETLPDWHTATGSTVLHFVYDAADPKNYYVYPQATANTDLDIIYSSAPADIAIADFETDTTTITLDDIYANCILDYILYRLYQKDSEYAGNPQRSMMHYQSFANALGIKTQADSATTPVPAVGV